MNMDIKNQIAGGLAIAITSNVERLYAGEIDDATFRLIQRGAWLVAEHHEIEELLRDLLIASRSAAKPAAPDSDWSHRADPDRWQDDFASDFAECSEDGEAGI